MSHSTQTSLPQGGKEWADRFRALLDRFGRNGRPWGLCEIQHASGGKVSQQYLSALQSGSFAKPGIDKLEAISDVLGAPFVLWFVPPERWEEHLNRNIASDIGNLCRNLQPEDVQAVLHLLERFVDARRIARNQSAQQPHLSRKQSGLLDCEADR